MATRLDNLGYARVFRDPRTGRLAVDTDSLRRGGFAGVEDFGADFYDDDDFGDDDDLDDDGFGDDDDFGDEEDEDFGDDDFGARRRPSARRTRRLNRRQQRLERRQAKIRTKLGQPARPTRKASSSGGGSGGSGGSNWGMTAVGGTDTLSAAGAASVKVRLQHDFRAQDITFTGSASGAKVTSIFFGDRVVWSSSDGIDVSVFSSTSFLRGLLKGQSLRAGLDITVNGSLGGAGDFAVTIIGQKPVQASC